MSSPLKILVLSTTACFNSLSRISSLKSNRGRRIIRNAHKDFQKAVNYNSLINFLFGQQSDAGWWDSPCNCTSSQRIYTLKIKSHNHKHKAKYMYNNQKPCNFKRYKCFEGPPNFMSLLTISKESVLRKQEILPQCQVYFTG